MYKRQIISKECVFCKKEFHPFRKTSKFCSLKCNGQNRHRSYLVEDGTKKICCRCLEPKFLSDFKSYIKHSKKDKIETSSICKVCSSETSNVKQYIREHKEKYLWYAARSRAKEKNLPFDIDVSDIVIPDFCPALGIPIQRDAEITMDGSPTLDRIIPELGYTKGNIAVISHRANQIKSNATEKELRDIAFWMEKFKCSESISKMG